MAQRCLSAGYDSVMIDGSHLPFKDNVALTKAAAELAHRSGAWIEGELGALPGDGDRTVEIGSGTLADPGARKFVELTDVDALAVAVGNVHGVPAAPVTLKLDRLAQIRDAVDVPLVLHGASGLPDEEIRAAIALGVAREAAAEAVRTKIRVFDCSDPEPKRTLA